MQGTLDTWNFLPNAPAKRAQNIAVFVNVLLYPSACPYVCSTRIATKRPIKWNLEGWVGRLCVQHLDIEKRRKDYDGGSVAFSQTFNGHGAIHNVIHNCQMVHICG